MALLRLLDIMLVSCIAPGLMVYIRRFFVSPLAPVAKKPDRMCNR
jgi:hypothetical protein